MNKECLYSLTILYVCWNVIRGCKPENKQVGVCLHVYLERDFLSLEKIIYPSVNEHRSSRDVESHRKHNKLKRRAGIKENVVGNFVVGRYNHRDWIEGPELEDHCKRLKQVLTCFEEVLIGCNSGYYFFRYRHLLYALSKTHDFLCATPQTRKERFLRLLKTIKCVEDARQHSQSCHRHNVTSVVWNKILRIEIGPEICGSLSTQRACLLENGYINSFCRSPEREQLYSDVSEYFLSIWCQYPIHPRLLSLTSQGKPSQSQQLISYGIPVLFSVFSFIYVPFS